MQQCVIHRTITVAPGRLAPGHLGELTQQVPFEMVDAVLDQTGTVQSRMRDLPSRVVVYLLLAGCLFAELGYGQVWQRLVAGLDGLGLPSPTVAALTKARRRVGAKPLRALFDLLRGPAATTTWAGARWYGLLVCAIDGTTMSVADTPANLAAYAKHACYNGGSGYPLLRLVALVACGTRTLIDAAFGPTGTGEKGYAQQLLPSLHHGMLVLLDRNFDSAALLQPLAATQAHLLVRLNNRKLPLLRRYPDGSWLSQIGATKIRVVQAEITIATSAGRRTGAYRLATTLTDHHRYPALGLLALYHQRWEIETAYLELKSSILGGRVLRARTPAGIDQEVYALLACYQVLRLAMADATSTQPGIDPDRASFTIALHAARDQLVQAAGVLATTTIDLAGKIGRQVLANLLADRRLRVSPRIVKRAISKYNARGPNINRSSYKATLSIHILTPPDPLTTNPGP